METDAELVPPRPPPVQAPRARLEEPVPSPKSEAAGAGDASTPWLPSAFWGGRGKRVSLVLFVMKWISGLSEKR